MDFNFKDRDIINGYDFTTQELCHIMDTAMIYEKRVKSGEAIKDMEGMLVATLFFEPSTRTRLSFNSAIQRMGASTIDLGSASASSQSKGETWQDTIRTVDGYVDAIVMRHPVAGSAIEAAEIAQHPLINGGDGARQHPTQALLDIYTMRKEKGHIGGQTITFLGDLKYGRTVHSLGYFMQQFGNRMIFASPEELRMPKEITDDLRAKGADIVETSDVKEALSQSDFVYVTRIQRERFPDEESYLRCKGSYIVNNELLKCAKKDITIMHPLPRVDEIATEVDSYPGAARLAAEIERGVCYVVMGEGAIQAVFCLIPGDEPTYRIVEDGDWPEDLPYATIHRMASAGQVRGIGQFCIDWCLRQGLPVRADTHADNVYMQHALEKSGFVRCGRIYTEDGSPRRAYYHKTATQKASPAGKAVRAADG